MEKIMKNVLKGIMAFTLVLQTAAFAYTEEAETFEGDKYYCRRERVRTENEQRSSCSLSVRFNSGSAYGDRSFNAYRNSRGEDASAQNDCRAAESEALAKCEDYRRYDAVPQGSGSCALASTTCVDYVWE